MINFALFIYWFGFLFFPLLFFVLWRWNKGKLKTWKMVSLGLFLVFLIYIRFVEPYWLEVQTTTLETPLENEVKVVVFADPHLGVYKGELFLSRVVETVNKQNPDLILIPGDFVFAMPHDQLESILSPLKNLNAPSFAVLGNHDLWLSEDLGDEIVDILAEYNIQFLEDKILKWETPKGEEITLTGSIDFWHYRKDEIEPLKEIADGWSRPSFFVHSPIIEKPENISPEDFVIWLAHNPDTSHYLGAEWDIDMLVAGHTHGGQIWIPGITKNLIPTKHEFVRDWSKINATDVFVTAGVGETGLPIRLGVRPVVDVILLK